MTKYTDDFFDGKRSWSFIKDKVLEGYMAPYIAKVARIGQRIVLIDGYAGPGIFEDGKIGSPIIMCRAAERYASCAKLEQYMPYTGFCPVQERTDRRIK